MFAVMSRRNLSDGVVNTKTMFILQERCVLHLAAPKFFKEKILCHPKRNGDQLKKKSEEGMHLLLITLARKIKGDAYAPKSSKIKNTYSNCF